MQVLWKIERLPFKEPFTISKGSKTAQTVFYVKLQHLGFTGYGEAAAISYYDITAEQMAEDLERKKIFVEKFAFTDPERYWHYLHHLFPKNPFLVCALDMAGWDLFGKMKRQPLYRLWNLDPEHAPLTDYTIGLDTPEKMLEKLTAHPWPVYKIKMGTEADMEMIRKLRAATDAPFRVDVNEGWRLEEALTNISILKEMNMQLIEQPLRKDDWEGMKILFEKSDLPVFADESCVHEEDVVHCPHHFHGINIKLTKCGGITPARRMIRDAQERNMLVMLGCMNESWVGTAALAHLAPMVNFLDADGPLLLAEDPVMAHEIINGKFVMNDQPGLGINWKENW